MTARRTRKAPEANIDVTEEIESSPIEVCEIEKPKRKYLDHSNCDHPRTGEAGKLARAKCRKALRDMVAQESEDAVAV